MQQEGLGRLFALDKLARTTGLETTFGCSGLVPSGVSIGS
jgi:hypothetical protein